MKSNNHILIITPGFPENENDFICIPPLQEYLKAFHSRFPGSNFTILALHYPYHNKKYFWNGIPVYSLAGKNTHIKKPLLWYKAFKKAKTINKENKIDAIHSLWYGECALLGSYLSGKFNCTHICTLMGQDVKSTNRYLRFLKNKKIEITALSKNQSDMFFKLTNKNADKIVHWGINDQPESRTDRDIDFLSAGSLIPLKNYSLFIKAVENIIDIKPDIKCVLAGEGPEESKLKSLATEKGVQNNIEFAGLLSRDELFKLMQRSRIFVHPSTFEGSGFVFAEALANGMNIVSFDIGYAFRHPKWFIAEDEEDFINIVKKLVTQDLDFSPFNPFPMNETVNQYALLYGAD